MKPNLTFLAALVLAPLALLHAAEPPLVLILSGQSNMAGYGKAAELSDEWRTPPPNVTLIHWGRTQALAKGSILLVVFRNTPKTPEHALPHSAVAEPGGQITKEIVG
jgi:hypothetical protein